jgi:hypothetical protein
VALFERIPNSIWWGLACGVAMQFCISLLITVVKGAAVGIGLTPVFSILFGGGISFFLRSQDRGQFLTGVWISVMPLALLYAALFILFGTGFVMV